MRARRWLRRQVDRLGRGARCAVTDSIGLRFQRLPFIHRRHPGAATAREGTSGNRPGPMQGSAGNLASRCDVTVRKDHRGSRWPFHRTDRQRTRATSFRASASKSTQQPVWVPALSRPRASLASGAGMTQVGRSLPAEPAVVPAAGPHPTLSSWPSMLRMDASGERGHLALSQATSSCADRRNGTDRSGPSGNSRHRIGMCGPTRQRPDSPRQTSAWT